MAAPDGRRTCAALGISGLLRQPTGADHSESGNRHGEVLVSTADTGFFYVTKKNPRNHSEKFTFRKYDPVARKHVEFKEAKIK